MRGIYSGGALVKLDQLGFSSVFDDVYAESAGAINACYFLAGQAEIGITIYTEDLQTQRFINPLRPRAMLNVDYIAITVLRHVKPLDTEKVMKSRSRLFVAITNALDGSPRLVDVHRERLSLYALLKATTAIVPLYNQAVILDGAPYVDGGISNPIPVQSALDAGCTHILVLLTRPPAFEMVPRGGLERLYLSLMLRRWRRDFVAAYRTERVRLYKRAREIALGRVPSSASIAFIGPGPDSPQISRMTLSRKKLLLAMKDAMHRTEEVLASAKNPVQS